MRGGEREREREKDREKDREKKRRRERKQPLTREDQNMLSVHGSVYIIYSVIE